MIICKPMKSLNAIIRPKNMILLLISVVPFSANAQTGGSALGGDTLFYIIMGMVFLVSFLVLVTAIYTLRVLNVMVRKDLAEAGLEDQPDMWSELMRKFTRSAPLEKEKDLLLDHDYDGIRELDNHLPPWWLWLFYFTMAFGVVYLLAYHVFDKLPLQEEEYRISMEQAEKAKAALAGTGAEVIDETTIEFSDDAAIIASGQKIFSMQCASCHGADGGGIIGPNLTDDHWLHGGSISDIFYTIKVGVPEKGMIAWGGVISPTQIRDVANYVYSIRGTSPANPMPPQGDLYVPGEEPAAHAEPAESVAETVSSEGPAEAVDEDLLAAGKTIFTTNCAVCHREDAGGSVGPNLTDKYWLHGGTREEIIHTINNGVITMGMIPWKGVLKDEEINAVAHYILSLQGSNPPNPKEPQGDPVE